MSAARQGVLLGLAYSLPLVVWSGSRWQPGSAAMVAADWRLTVETLLLVQALVSALYVPAWTGRVTGWEQWLGLLLLQWVPLPLLALAWLGGALDAGRLCLGPLMLACGGGLLIMASGLVYRLTGRWQRLPLAVLQGMVAAVIWAFRAEWLAWLGG
jgi:hypothetical protein